LKFSILSGIVLIPTQIWTICDPSAQTTTFNPSPTSMDTLYPRPTWQLERSTAFCSSDYLSSLRAEWWQSSLLATLSALPETWTTPRREKEPKRTVLGTSTIYRLGNLPSGQRRW
jgi:hypothetical protein